MNKSHLLMLAAIALPCIATAEELRLTAQELIDRSAQRMSATEVKSLLVPGVSVETVAGNSGNVRQWTHGPDGHFVASSRGQMGTQTTGQGAWRVSDDGQYCVEIKWKTVDEQWCRTVYKLPSGTYLAPENLARNADKQFGMLRVLGQGAAPTLTASNTPQPGSAALAAPASAGVATLLTSPPAAAAAATAATAASTSRTYLTRSELEQAFVGKTFTFKDVATGSIVKWDVRDGGRLYANNLSTRYNISGTWEIKDDGALCVRFSDGSSGCAYHFSHGGKLQRTRSNTPTDPVIASVEKFE